MRWGSVVWLWETNRIKKLIVLWATNGLIVSHDIVPITANAKSDVSRETIIFSVKI